MKHLQRNVCLKFIKEKLNFLIIPSFLLDTIQNLNNQVPFDTSTVGTYIRVPEQVFPMHQHDIYDIYP